jgi:hypothetical protein
MNDGLLNGENDKISNKYIDKGNNKMQAEQPGQALKERVKRDFSSLFFFMNRLHQSPYLGPKTLRIWFRIREIIAILS